MKTAIKTKRCIICKRITGATPFFCPCDLVHGRCPDHMDANDCAWASQHPDYVSMVPCESCDRYRPENQPHPHEG